MARDTGSPGGRRPPRLPSGTVTMLFSDIEGSTRLARALREAYGDVLETHRRLLREAFAAHGGRVVDAQGDEIFAVFARARDAVAGAVRGRRALACHRWPDGVEVRVRMGLHTGEPALRRGAYVGVEVHRAARISAGASGGQILVSAATEALVADDLPDGVRLLDLGERRLKDLDRRPLRVYALETAADAAASPAERPVRVLLADDAVLLRAGLARLLDASGFEVVGQAGDADDLLSQVEALAPDVAIVDVRMPPTHTDEGLRAARAIRSSHPETGVLVLSQYVEPQYAVELFAETSEGIGYLLKDRVADLDEFTDAVRRVARGGSALDAAVVSQLVAPRRRNERLAALTAREREVLSLMAEGLSDAGIAERLELDEQAVEEHAAGIFRKLELDAAPAGHRRVRAVLVFLEA